MSGAFTGAPVDWRLRVDDEVIKASDGMEVASLCLDLDDQALDALTIELNDSAGGVLSSGRHGVGDEVELDLGDGSARRRLFTGDLCGLEASWPRGRPRVLRLHAYDRLHRLRRGNSARSWSDLGDAEIVRQLCSELGLRARVDPTEGRRDHVIQAGLDDASFLRQLADRNGRELRFDGEELTFVRPAAGETIELAADLDAIELDVHIDALDQVGEVLVRGWDTARKDDVLGRATADRLRGPPGAEAGARIADKSWGRRRIVLPAPAHCDQGLATTIAESHLFERARSFVTGTLLCVGRPELRPGVELRLIRAGDFSGRYRVRAVRHRVGPSGHRCELRFDSPFVPEGE